jgi:hypothetical protein
MTKSLATARNYINRAKSWLLVLLACVICNLTLASTAEGATCPVTNTGDLPTGGSLRTCIIFANGNAGADTITFSIAGAGPHTIVPTSALPVISDPVTIDGSTEPDFVTVPIVVLDGSSTGAVHGLEINSSGDGSTIRSLRIVRFSNNSIQVQAGADGVTIAGNWIGSDGIGASGPGNGNNGINILGANATIGGTGALDGNVINNNGNEGINLTGGGATGNTILGNYIGLEADSHGSSLPPRSHG